MGLDISFNRAAALAAGATFRKERAGNEEEIRLAIQDGDKHYLNYLQSMQEYVRIPGMSWDLHNGGYDSIVVRANKWGNNYEPLTTWLKANNITWDEF